MPRLLQGLARESLVIAEEGGGGGEHYSLLETLRQYAHERLRAAGDEETGRDRHATYYLELAEQAEPQLCIRRGSGTG